MSKYDLAYLQIGELHQYTGADTAVDKLLVFDSSANRVEYIRYNGGNTAAGSTLTVTAASHSSIGRGGLINLDTVTGSVVTLPAATGTGNIYRFRVSALATSNSHQIKVANSSDVMQGFAVVSDTDSSSAASMFMTTSTSDTITLNRTTTGSVTVGEYIEIEDVATGVFSVRAFLSGTGVVATPFSATV